MSPIIHTVNELGHPIRQGSRDWFELRRGKPTSSRISSIVQPKKLGYSDGAQTYMSDVIVEQMLGVSLEMTRLDG